VIKSGVYQLLIEIPETRRFKIGNLGYLKFQSGLYIYTGSARGKSFPRLRRHFTREKIHFWHIDYLLEHAHILAYHIEPFRQGLECRLNKSTKRLYTESKYIPAFGSSDCKCLSHLIYLPKCQKHQPRQGV
jgi:Uri superfamily endonuclease